MSCELLFSSEEQQEEARKEENEGEGSNPAEEFCPPGDVAFDLGFYYSHCIGDAVDAGLQDGVAKELVAVFDRTASEIDGVAGHLLHWLRKGAMGGTACQHEG